MLMHTPRPPPPHTHTKSIEPVPCHPQARPWTWPPRCPAASRRARCGALTRGCAAASPAGRATPRAASAARTTGSATAGSTGRAMTAPGSWAAREAGAPAHRRAPRGPRERACPTSINCSPARTLDWGAAPRDAALENKAGAARKHRPQHSRNPWPTVLGARIDRPRAAYSYSPHGTAHGAAPAPARARAAPGPPRWQRMPPHVLYMHSTSRARACPPPRAPTPKKRSAATATHATRCQSVAPTSLRHRRARATARTCKWRRGGLKGGRRPLPISPRHLPGQWGHPVPPAGTHLLEAQLAGPRPRSRTRNG